MFQRFDMYEISRNSDICFKSIYWDHHFFREYARFTILSKLFISKKDFDYINKKMMFSGRSFLLNDFDFKFQKIYIFRLYNLSLASDHGH